MSLNRYDAKRDANEADIVKEFERHGMTVFRLDRPLDLLVGYNNRNYLVEIKMPKKKLNATQTKFTLDWKGQYFICHTIQQANRFIMELLKK